MMNFHGFDNEGGRLTPGGLEAAQRGGEGRFRGIYEVSVGGWLYRYDFDNRIVEIHETWFDEGIGAYWYLKWSDHRVETITELSEDWISSQVDLNDIPVGLRNQVQTVVLELISRGLISHTPLSPSPPIKSP